MRSAAKKKCDKGISACIKSVMDDVELIPSFGRKWLVFDLFVIAALLVLH